MGGWKESGLGSRHGAGGIRKYCAQQTILVKRLAPEARHPHVPVQGQDHPPDRARVQVPVRPRQARLSAASPACASENVAAIAPASISEARGGRMPDAPRIPPLEPPYDADTESHAAQVDAARRRCRAAGAVPHARGPRGPRRPHAAAGRGHPRARPDRAARPRDRDRASLRARRRRVRVGRPRRRVRAAARAHRCADRRHACTASADDPAWSEREALIVRLVDELHDAATVSDELWAELAAQWKPPTSCSSSWSPPAGTGCSRA